MSDEYAGLVLEDQLLDHLATPEGATAVWSQRLSPDIIPDNEEGIREALRFVIEYMDEFREPPPIPVLVDETGYAEFDTPVAPIEYVMDKLRERHQRRELKKVVTSIARKTRDPNEALSYGLDEFMRIRMETSQMGDTLTSHDLHKTLERYEDSLNDPSQGVSYGYELIDQHMGGMQIGELSVILALPKRYKSWQLLKSATQTVLGDEDNEIPGRNVDFATMELTTEEMHARFTCMVAGVSWYKWKHKILTRKEKDKITRTGYELQEWPHKLRFYRPKPGERNVGYLTAQALENEAEALYIDQLSWFDGVRTDERSWQKIGKIMEELKDSTRHFPIYMAAQFSREAANTEGIADITKIGLSNAIGETADNLFGIYASRDMLENKILHLGIIDSRSFEPVTWEIKVELTQCANFRCLQQLDG